MKWRIHMSQCPSPAHMTIANRLIEYRRIILSGGYNCSDQSISMIFVLTVF